MHDLPTLNKPHYKAGTENQVREVDKIFNKSNGNTSRETLLLNEEHR